MRTRFTDQVKNEIANCLIIKKPVLIITSIIIEKHIKSP